MQPLVVEQDLIGYYDGDGSDGSEFYSFYDSDDMYANDDIFNSEDKPIEVDAKQVYSRRVGEGPVIENVNEDDLIEIDASQVGLKRVGEEPIIEHPPEIYHVSDSSDSGGSGLEDETEVNPGLRDFLEDSSDS